MERGKGDNPRITAQNAARSKVGVSRGVGSHTRDNPLLGFQISIPTLYKEVQKMSKFRKRLWSMITIAAILATTGFSAIADDDKDGRHRGR